MMIYVTDYEQEALGTAPGAEEKEFTPQQKCLLLGALGLCGEAGEVAEMVKKHVFHEHPMDAAKVEHLIKELGDVLWYITYVANKTGHNLADDMSANVKKLRARYPEGRFSSDRSINRAEGDV